MMSLRDELLGRVSSIPAFRMIGPPGWELHEMAPDVEQRLVARARERLMAAHQPVLFARLGPLVAEAFASARAQGAIFMIMPGAETPPGLLAPVTILGSLQRSTPSAPLDARVAEAIEHHGARALGDSRHFLRWEHRKRARIDGDEAETRTLVYLTPLPGTGRSSALQLTATLVQPIETDAEMDARIADWIAMIDASVATFAWVRP
ncbi:hypothetical protein [Microbacterium thalli]|uniref:Uncharacterized protein n=1 Tax=Microbacterium thalli TaxID=3027921 RepID=A0ABT5SMD3_9MICO|nr:hypothetical protein [Microbacterium thalli]MDD7963182.1 hypothetical protein [Microbacterium thalli]MDN8548119.1 hypothetical protein [Microbacterium thalli]